MKQLKLNIVPCTIAEANEFVHRYHQDGVCTELTPLKRPTEGNGCSLWLTPITQDHKSDGPRALEAWKEALKNGKRPSTTYLCPFCGKKYESG